MFVGNQVYWRQFYKKWSHMSLVRQGPQVSSPYGSTHPGYATGLRAAAVRRYAKLGSLCGRILAVSVL